MEKRDILRYFLVVMIFLVLFSILIVLRSGFTGYAIFEGPEEGQYTLMLQVADTENLGDVYVGGDSANTNFNYRDYLLVKWGTPKRNTYLNFNISDIPDDQIIDNSQVCLYLYDDQGAQTIYVYSVYVDFNESTLTWNNQPCGTNFDNSSNCNLTAESSLTPDGNQDNTW
jgi:hypothetical protein